jgi:hypothetical protein
VSLSVIELVARYRSRSQAPRDALLACVARIEAEGERPIWISRFSVEQVLAQLEAADPTGPLYGVPFAVKDNIDVAGLPTTAACPDFSYLPVRHAGVVERYVQAWARPTSTSLRLAWSAPAHPTVSRVRSSIAVISPAARAPVRRWRWPRGKWLSRWAPTPRARGECRRRSISWWG